MIAESILSTLLRINLVASAAILLTLALRPLVQRRLGAITAYRLWLIVPVAALASLLPAREQMVVSQSADPATAAAEPIGTNAPSVSAPAVSGLPAAQPFIPFAVFADGLVTIWLLVAGALLTRSIITTRRLAADPSLGPALIGTLRPKLILPTDFATRFSAEERVLILAHEQVHRVSGHALVNALIELARCANWLNPLVHVAAIRVRTDQELACDATVIAQRPTARRAYAEALLKTHASSVFLPLGCTWTSASGKRLGERIVLLGRPASSRLNTIAGVSAVTLVSLTLGFAAWAQQPARLVTQNAPLPPAVWTATADAPKGALSTALEGNRHDRAIKLAQQGNIDVVFFGSTNTEMWWWPDRGRPAWDRRFASIRAANFGSQGTHPESLLWRMRNGELAGFKAKLVVLQTWLGAGAPIDPNEAIATFAPIIAEIRTWQPQAKILVFADLPRGQLNREAWRQVAQANTAAYASLVDNKTVFYVDMGERFFRPDGTHNQDMWRFPPLSGGVNAGAQAAAFEAWADELEPWLDRFVR